MRPRQNASKAGSKQSRARMRGVVKTPTEKPAKAGRPETYLERILRLIREHPGIRPSEINRHLNLEQSDALRNTLIERGLIRKARDGSAVRYYLV